MLKEVGASGQISLAKSTQDSCLTCKRRRIHEWSSQQATEIDEYNAWAEQREPYSQRVRRWRAEQQK